MAGRHRRPPAWRRLLLRLRRSDRAARTAALEAEVVALRAMVQALQEEIGNAWAAAARAADELAAATAWATVPGVATASAPPPPRVLDLTLVEAPAALATARPSDVTLALGIRASETTREVALVQLPEAALLDARQDRDEADDVVDVRPAEQRTTGRRTA